MKIYVAVRETGDLLEEVNTIEEGLKVIEQYEEQDKKMEFMKRTSMI